MLGGHAPWTVPLSFRFSSTDWLIAATASLCHLMALLRTESLHQHTPLLQGTFVCGVGGVVCVCVCVYSHSSHVRLFFDSMNCSSPGSSVHRISQVRILEWVAISYSKDLHDPRMEPASLASSAAAGRFFTAAQRGKLDTCKDVCGSLRKGNPISQVLSSAMQLQLFVPSLV